ncbi:MAG: hypothetical protein H7839_18785, partial [Magnetococcus sp. YQC-5]
MAAVTMLRGDTNRTQTRRKRVHEMASYSLGGLHWGNRPSQSPIYVVDYLINVCLDDLLQTRLQGSEHLTVMSRLATPPMMKDNHRWVATARSRMEMEAPTLIS